MKLKKIVLFVTVGMLAINLLACSPKNSTNNKNTERKQENKQEVNSNNKVEVKELKSDTILSHEEMKEDLDSLVKTLKDVHPKTYNGFSEEQKTIINKAYEKIKEPIKMGEFYFIANEIICSFKDAHTNMSMSINGKDKIIDLYPIWLNDGLYVKESIGELEKGDKLLSIGGKTPDELLKYLSIITPAENDNWVKLTACFDLTRESYLRHFNMVENEHVNIKLLRNNKSLEIKLPFITINKSETASLLFVSNKSEWVSYTIDKENSLGILKLDSCNYNSEYVDEVKKFFEEVSKNNIQNIAVDLRENTGGDSSVVDEFIKYLSVDKYLSHGSDIRYSLEANKQRHLGKTSGYESNEITEKDNTKFAFPELIFEGNVYALTSPQTFSSANWFAVILQDNNIGKIIGEPTGNQPSSYGDILSFKLPNSKYMYQVSFKKFTRPNTDKDSENCLTPDIIVYTTIEDIINGRDPQMEKLLEFIKHNN